MGTQTAAHVEQFEARQIHVESRRIIMKCFIHSDHKNLMALFVSFFRFFVFFLFLFLAPIAIQGELGG